MTQQRHGGRLCSLMCVIVGCSSAVLAGCAISPPALETPMTPGAPISLTAAESHHHEDRQRQPTVGNNLRLRRTAGVVQTGALLTKIAYIEPLIRPLSTDIALISLVLKSTGGFARRVAIDSVQFQRLEREPIPALAQRPGMDPEQWERDLDRIGGVASRGGVDFPIHGGQDFPRMLRPIRKPQA